MINKISISIVLLLQFCNTIYSQNWEGKYDKIGRYCSDCDLCAVKKEGKWGFVNQKTGELVIPVQFDDVVLAPEFKGNYAWITLNGKDGVIDINGKFIIPAKYDGIKKEFKNDLALVSNYVKKGWAQMKYGFVNNKGEEIIPLIYDNADSFTDGYTSVRLKDKWGLIDTTGKIILPLQYDGVSQIVYPGLVGVMKLKPGEFESSDVRRMSSKHGVVDLKGNEIVPIKYNVIDLRFINGYLKVKNQDDKYGFVNTKGVEVVSCKYDDINPFFDDFATVSIAGKWGYVDKTGKEIIPLIYDGVSNFENDIAQVFLNGKRLFVNKKGEEVEKQ